jgi:hypothetical protein
MFPDYDKAKRVSVDPFDTTLLGHGIPNYALDPSSFAEDFPPLATPEQMDAINQLYSQDFQKGPGLSQEKNNNETWIQTYSGRRFNPLNPNPDAIVIQDIAHSLSMQCRFTGHSRKFYSVAQHCVLVSYICDSQDALWGLLHDASEAYCVDVPRPLKRSGKMEGYREIENNMQAAVCKRFGLPAEEPVSVKKADTILLATEARDLMSPLHPNWVQPVEPLPFKIDAWDHDKAKDMFMKRFFEVSGMDPGNFEHYLQYKDRT